MSGNQETQVRQLSLLCSDFNAGIPIKKRKFFVMPMSPPAEDASTALPENSREPNEQNGTRSVSCSLDVNEKNENTLPEENRGSCATDVVTDQKIIDQPSLSNEEQLHLFRSDFIGNDGNIEKPVGVKAVHIAIGSPKDDSKIADIENITRGLVDQRKVKTEVVDLPVSSVSFTDAEKKWQLGRPSGFNMVSSSVQSYSLAMLANKEKLGEAENSGAAVSSEKTGMRIDQTVHTMYSMIEETCDKKNVSRGCQAELSSGSGYNDKLSVGCKTGDGFQHRGKEESLALNLSLSKWVCPPHKNDDSNGVNRSNWDLNTPMDAWEDARDCTSTSKANLVILSSESCPCDDKASNAYDKTIILNSVSEELRKGSVGFRSDVETSMQCGHQDKSSCSLSLGLSSCPPAQELPVSARTTQTSSAYSSFCRPTMTAGNLNSVSLRVVKSEHLDEVVRQETENAEICPVKLSSNRVKQELVEKYSQETISSSGFLNSIDPTSIKVEPSNCIQSEAVNRKDGTLNQPDLPSTQPGEMHDLPTCSISSQKEKQMSYSIGCKSVPVSLAGMTVNPGEAHGVLEKTLRHAETSMNSTCFGQGDNSGNVSGMTVASLTEDKSVDDRKTCRLNGPPLDSRGTDENSRSDEEKINLSGDMLEVDLCGSDFESDGAHELSKVKRKQDGTIHEDGNVKESAVAVVTEENSPAKNYKLEEHTNCGGSETKNRKIALVCHVDFQNSSCVDERGSESTVLGKTGNEHIKECSGTSLDKHNKYADDDSCLMELVEMPICEDKIKRLIPELQRRAASDGSGETEAQIIQDFEPLSYQVIHTSEGVSGASTVSSVTVQIPDIIDKSSTASFEADISTGDPPKEFNGGGRHSRIINLARVSDKSPAKTLDASSSVGPSRLQRDNLLDLTLESRKFLSQGRDEAFSDVSYKFSRERYHDRFGNQRLDFMPDRRRFSDRTESNPRGRDSESKFILKFSGDGKEFPVSRIQNNSDPMDADFEFDNYGNAREDGVFFRSFHRGRRSWNDQATFFPHPYSRRQSGYSFRGPRNSEDASAFQRLRDGEKFTRGLSHSNIDPMVRPQRPYDDLDGRFVRGQRNFSTNHKRHFPQFRSRSPNRARARSPGPCSSFRNRSPDGFAGCPEFPCRRSSPSYRMERIRSPDHSGFPRDMAVRRHGSSAYPSRPSNVLRDVGRGCRRPGISFRNHHGRTFRNHGKFNISDSRERVEYGDDMYEEPSHSDQFGEFGVNVNVERRRFGDRHDRVRSFRPSFNIDEQTPSSIENGSDSLRSGQEDATDTEEQGNLREFDRQNKNFTENASGRTRNVEDKEESSRNFGEILPDSEFSGGQFN